MDQAGSGGEFLELGDKWYMGTVHDVTSPYDIGNVPAYKAGRKSRTGRLAMVPYPPAFLTDSQLIILCSLHRFVCHIHSVIPKERLERPCLPTLLLVWQCQRSSKTCFCSTGLRCDRDYVKPRQPQTFLTWTQTQVPCKESSLSRWQSVFVVFWQLTLIQRG